MRLDGKKAFVTGGASGIGRAICEGFAEAGAEVVVTDIDEKGGAETTAAITGAGGGASFRKLDITSKDDISAAAEACAGEGGLDILVNAAGWDRIEPFMENDDEFIERIVTLNYLGAVRLTKAMLPMLMESGHGRVINVASDAGRVGSMGETVYAGAKGGIIAFTKSLAREMARHRVNVNCVCPGPTDTPLFAGQPEKMREALIRAIPMKRLAKPSELADACLFFACGRSDYVTGQVLSVSGGLTMVD